MNRVTDHGGTVGGGALNVAGDDVGEFTSSHFSTVAGGLGNKAIAVFAAVGGGAYNTASGYNSTVAGGRENTASGSTSTVAGGFQNQASGPSATVPGGVKNEAGGALSFAAGGGAKVRNATQSNDFDGDEGTFVWSDAQGPFFTSTGPNQFLIRAGGGVGINTNAPAGNALAVAGNAAVTGNVGVGTTDPRTKLHVTGGSVYIGAPNSLVITSPNGNCWFITVNDAGGLGSFQVACR